MSEYFLNISSQDGDVGQFSDNFSISFSPAIRIPGNWEMALVCAQLYYSWYNINAQYNNQTFRYYNGTAWKVITITPGLYGIADINAYVQNAMYANGDYTVVNNVNTFHIVLTPDYNTFKLLITISNGYQLDLTQGNLYQIFGFNPVIVSSTQEGANNVNISLGVNQILLHIDCITGSYVNGSASDVIYSFSPNVPPSSLIQVAPYRLIYLPVTKTGYLDRMRIYVTDPQNNRFNLNGENITLGLALKPIK